MDLIVDPAGWLIAGPARYRCALGRAGIVADKREGDGATPTGAFPLRRLLFRQTRIADPKTKLPRGSLEKDDGWCDCPADPRYNQPVKLPYCASAEPLWRSDHLYDLIVVLGHNDDPVQSGFGSAIFLHCARTNYAPTKGCFALATADLLDLLVECSQDDRLIVGPIT